MTRVFSFLPFPSPTTTSNDVTHAPSTPADLLLPLLPPLPLLHRLNKNTRARAVENPIALSDNRPTWARGPRGLQRSWRLHRGAGRSPPPRRVLRCSGLLRSRGPGTYCLAQKRSQLDSDREANAAHWKGTSEWQYQHQQPLNTTFCRCRS